MTRFGLVGPTTGGIRWFGSPDEVARSWRLEEFSGAKLRVCVNGRVGHGTASQVKPVYDAQSRLVGEGL